MSMGSSWISLLLLLLLSLQTVPGLLGASRVLVARCPRPSSSEPSYCSCSNTTVSIRCDFNKKEDVVLTKELLAPYANISHKTAYVRVANATSVRVMGDFVEKWLEAPSAAFDIWHSGTITLFSMPRADNNTNEQLGTFAGVGIVNCHIPELPTGFLRDRIRAALRIKQGTVGVVRTGFVDNVREMRYIVLQDSMVDEVEVSVAAEGYITLSQLSVHTWNGLILSNTSINILGPGAFNLTHKLDMEVMSVKNCRVGRVATGALSATGDIHVNITNNIFDNLEEDAFKVDVTGNVYFNGNKMGAQGLDALRSLRCHNASSLQNNSILVTTPLRPVHGQSFTPLHASCGKPQLFMMLIPVRQILVQEDTRAAWVFGATLVVLGMAMVVGVAWSFRRQRPILSMGRFPDLLKRRSHKTSLENLPKNIELNIPHEDPEEGTSVKDLDMACEPDQDTDQTLFKGGIVSQSVPLPCDAAPFAASDGQQDSASFLGEDFS